MSTEELQTLEIPLSKLLSCNDNVRMKRSRGRSIELAESIAAVGLLQGLVVKKEPRESVSPPQTYTSPTSERRQRSPLRVSIESRFKTSKEFHVLTESVCFCPSVGYVSSTDSQLWRFDAVQERSVFIAECLCGRRFETPLCEYVCPACNRHIVLDWGRDFDQEPNKSVDELSVTEAVA